MTDFVLLWSVARQEPQFNQAELSFRKQAPALGGELGWFREDDEWQLCLDVTQGDKTFDFAVVKRLRRLAVLRIFQGHVKETSLKALRGHPKLSLLVILSNGLTDKGMALIGDIPHISKLDVKGETISAKGLWHLSRMKKLKRLFLYNTNLRDRDLEPLKGLKQLHEVMLPNTVSASGIEELKRRLPQVRVNQI